MKLLAFLAIATTMFVDGADALQSPRPPVSQLLTQHAASIAALKSIATESVGSIAEVPYSNDVFYLHFCLQDSDNADAMQESFQKSLEWRLGDGKSICDAARIAVDKAQQEEGSSWNNQPVLDAAPYYNDIISKYLTTTNVMTTTNNDGDLVYCIRAGKINDNELMSAVTIDQMNEFFLYAKEVNALVSFQRSMESDRLCTVLTANDLAGVKLVGGSTDFRNALSASSKVAAVVYPTTVNGPTFLCNLPRLLNAIVKLFTPLFPDSVKARLKFAKIESLAQAESLLDLASTTTANTAKRNDFLQAIDQALA